MNSTCAYKIGDLVETCTSVGWEAGKIIDEKPMGGAVLYLVKLSGTGYEYWKFIADIRPYVPVQDVQLVKESCTTHSWVEYIGFTDRFWYCETCDEKCYAPRPPVSPAEPIQDLPW